jgi:mannose-6-phosphate isomerase-like protein (cupin superfamily)
VTRAVAHRTVEEVWFFVGGRGRIWRRLGDDETTVDVFRGVSIAIPTGAAFQFRADGDEPLEIVGVTMPPWPGEAEAYPVEGIWPATV